MNILLCVKQVPDTADIRIDPEKNVLIRKGVPSILNPFDSYALEAAARIKDRDPATKIVALSMGPPQAEAVLRECLAIAADRAYLISGRAFGGSDTLATSYILSEAIKLVSEQEGPCDAVFCGKQAIDGDTAQVGPEIAEHLGIPQVTYGLEAEASGDVLNVRRETEAGLRYLYDNGIKLRVSGIITPDQNTSSHMLTGSIGYTKDLTEYVITQSRQSEAVASQLENPNTDIFTGLIYNGNTLLKAF